MEIFKKKKVDEVAKDVVQASAELLFKEYSELKGKEYEMKKRRDEIVESIKELADANEKWEGKTARFNQYALEKKHEQKLVLPINFPEELFHELNQHGYVKYELDKSKILKELPKEEFLQTFDFEIEIKESYVPKGF
jgi:hypothetical protein